MEIYLVQPPISNGTIGEDADAIMNIKKFYNLVGRNWVGDPCNPKEYIWDGLNCTYATDHYSRIVSLILPSSGLDGEMSPSIANLTELQRLDLSMNNLTGGIPDFLGNLSHLTYLNLTGNNFSGEVPKSLRDRASTGALILSFGNNQSTTNDPVEKNPVVNRRDKKNNTWKIAVGIVAAILGIALVLVLVFFAISRSKRNQREDSSRVRNSEKKTGTETSHRANSFRMPSFRAESIQFTYSELTKITNNFAKVIGVGGFGTVYYGELENGKRVAVKKLSQSSNQGFKEFQTEAQLLTRIYHKNLVPLVGYCKNQDNMLLVYEYMAKGSLADQFSDGTQNFDTISWRERLRIGVEAAQGIDYLHKGCKPPIVHRDIKASNILLSEELEAKIADFGLSRIFNKDEENTFVSTAVMGTPGYLDPEYSITCKLNDKSDVYSFGIVLLELITGKPAIIRRPSMINIVNWIEPLLESADLNQIMDPRFRGDYNPNSVWKALEVAKACVAQFSIQRPAIGDVLIVLKESLEIELLSGRRGDDTSRSTFNTSLSGSIEIHPSQMSSILNPHAR